MSESHIAPTLLEWMVERGLADEKWRQRIKDARDAKGYSQADLATRLNVSQQAIADLETKKKSLSPALFMRLAEVLDQRAEWLAFGHECPVISPDALDRPTVRFVILELGAILHRHQIAIDPDSLATQAIALSELLKGQSRERIRSAIQSLDPIAFSK